MIRLITILTRWFNKSSKTDKLIVSIHDTENHTPIVIHQPKKDSKIIIASIGKLMETDINAVVQALRTMLHKEENDAYQAELEQLKAEEDWRSKRRTKK